MGFAALFFVRLQRGVALSLLAAGALSLLAAGALSLPASRWLFAAASLPAVLCADGPLPATASLQRPCRQQTLSAPLPATNLIRQRSTPVWLAIWRTWAGFANSQHRDAAFATPDNICAHSSLLQTLSSCSDRRKSVGPSAPIAYATYVSPPNEAAAWPGTQVFGAG